MIYDVLEQSILNFSCFMKLANFISLIGFHGHTFAAKLILTNAYDKLARGM